MPRCKNPRRLVNSTPLALVGCLLLVSCGESSGGNGLHLKEPNFGEKDIAIRSGYAFAVNKTFTDATGKMTTAVTYRVYAANYDLDAANFAMTMDKPLTSDDQVRIVFSLIGDAGTNDKSPPMAGTYSAKADKFMKVEDVAIVSRKGAGDSKTGFDRSTLKGQVKVTSASANEIAGDLDLAGGDNFIKGSFTAKILKRK